MHRVKAWRSTDARPSAAHDRTSQNWIGGTHPGNARFVLPLIERRADCMGVLERFEHADDDRSFSMIKWRPRRWSERP